MSVIGTTAGIDHGTVRGYRQHAYRKVKACEPCRTALREHNREQRETTRRTAPEKSARKPGPPRFASQAQAEWYGGAFPANGAARTPTTIRPPGDCPSEGCGAEADLVDDSGLVGWVRAGVYGSTEPDRLWCSGSCAAYGVALAELRMGEAAA